MRKNLPIEVKFFRRVVEGADPYEWVFSWNHLQIFLQIPSRIAALDLCDLLGGAGGHHIAAAVAALGAEVDDVVGGFDDVEVVLDDEDGIARIHKLLQNLDELVDIGGVEAGGGLVQDIDGAPRGGARQLRGQLDPLGLASLGSLESG